jgi:hypothetical protein
MQEPLKRDGKLLDCRASIGGAISLGFGMSPEELQKQADLALYRSKTSGRGSFRMFVTTMREEAQKNASALEVATSALASDWIVPFYQPKMILAAGTLNGFEALLRWTIRATESNRRKRSPRPSTTRNSAPPSASACAPASSAICAAGARPACPSAGSPSTFPPPNSGATTMRSA